jgi:hypothetical protein
MPSNGRTTSARTVLLKWTARVGAVTAEAVADRYELALRSARATLVAAERKRLLLRRRPLAGDPALYVLTRAGQRAAGVPPATPCGVSPANAMHLIACAHAAAALERSYPQYTVVGERELRRRWQDPAPAGACARLGYAPGGAPMLHRPDLLLLPPVGATEASVAVEVELTVKSPRRLEEICRSWARCRGVAGVMYVAAPGVERALQRAVVRAHASSKVVVVPFDAIVQRGSERPGG